MDGSGEGLGKTRGINRNRVELQIGMTLGLLVSSAWASTAWNMNLNLAKRRLGGGELEGKKKL
jgi:hypothetical protein